MKDCAYYQELISCLLDRELTVEEGEELAAHARGCADCQAAYKAFSLLSDTLSGELEEPPAELAENVMAQIRREEIRARHTAPKLNRRILSFAALAVLVIGVSSLTLPRLLSRKGAAAAAPQAALTEESVMMAAGERDGLEASYAAAADDSPAEADMPIPVSESFAAPASDTTKSEQEMINEALARAEEPETAAEIVDVSWQGRGTRIAALLVGTPGDLPAGQTPDRRFLLRFDVDGISSQVLVSVYGDKVFYISLSGEESDMMLSDYSWAALRGAIYN